MIKVRNMLAGILAAALVGGTVCTGYASGVYLTDSKTSSELGYSFTDIPIINNSWSKRVAFSVDFENAGIEHYCYMTCGFKDGATSNSDYVKIGITNGVATGIFVYGTVKNSNGVSASTTSVTNGGESTEASVPHTGTPVTYSVTFRD